MDELSELVEKSTNMASWTEPHLSPPAAHMVLDFLQPDDRVLYLLFYRYRLNAGVDHAVLTRADYHSSIIKRVASETQDDIERQFVRESRGFCECGWPLGMLLPRGNNVKTSPDI